MSVRDTAYKCALLPAAQQAFSRSDHVHQPLLKHLAAYASENVRLFRSIDVMQLAKSLTSMSMEDTKLVRYGSAEEWTVVRNGL